MKNRRQQRGRRKVSVPARAMGIVLSAKVMQKIQSELFAAKERIHQPRTLFVVESGLVPLGPSWTRGMPGRQ